MASLQQSVSLVTGASSGIGRAVAIKLAEEGSTLALIGRDPKKLEQTAHQCRSLGISALVIPTDVTDEAQVMHAIDRIQRELGSIHIAVNSAGIALPELMDVDDLSSDTWQTVMDVNVQGTFHVCRHVIGPMKRQGRGAIINIGSTASYRALAGNSAYAASKHAVKALTEALANECDGTGVRVSLVSPGPVNTPIWDLKKEPVDQSWREELLKPEDIANIVYWLISLPKHVRIDDILVRPTTGGRLYK